MLEIRPTRENCNTSLPFDSQEAIICELECTFCEDCVANILEHACPNCGGSFEKRSIRPNSLLKKYPTLSKVVCKPTDIEEHIERIINN
jgi:hypothetical protein